VTTPPAADDRDLARRLLQLEREVAELRGRDAMLEPLVALILDMRRQAREMGAYEAADSMRDQLVELGIELSDASDGSTEFRLPGETGRD
jgi:cysteinyl-tRNA synthetase